MAPQNGALPAPKGLPSAPRSLSERELEAALSDSSLPVASKPLARHRIKDILRPEYPLERALQVLKTQPEARALFESQRHHDRLRLPSETKQFICVLRNPTNGNLVYLVGTAHGTKASGNDVRMLIEAVLPDKVALELDPTRLDQLEKGLLSPASFPSTTWEVCKYTWRVPFDAALSLYSQYFMAQTVGAQYGADMLSGIHTARRLNIPIETIDQELGLEKWQQLVSNLGGAGNVVGTVVAKPDGAADVNGAKTVLASEQRPATHQWIQNQAAPILFEPCDDSKGASDAFVRVFAAFQEGRPVPLADVAVFRSCANQKFQSMRLDLASDAGDVSKTMEGRMYKELVSLEERDDNMGANLAALSEKHKKTVAVVGAAHMTGVRARFAENCLLNQINLEGKAQRARARIEMEAAQKAALEQTKTEVPFGGILQNVSAKEGAFWTGTIAVAGFACYKRPRLMVKLAGGLAAFEGGSRVVLAALTAKWVQFGAYLDEATRLMEKSN